MPEEVLISFTVSGRRISRVCGSGIQSGPKKIIHYQMIKKSYQNVWILRHFVNLKYESSTIILFFGIRYSMRDLLYDLNNYAWPSKWRYASETVNDVNAPVTSARLSRLWILCLNDVLDGGLCINIFYFHIFSFFWLSSQTWFYQMRWFYLYRSFKHSKWWRHKLGHT